jgi:hypothetical protein
MSQSIFGPTLIWENVCKLAQAQKFNPALPPVPLSQLISFPPTIYETKLQTLVLLSEYSKTIDFAKLPMGLQNQLSRLPGSTRIYLPSLNGGFVAKTVNDYIFFITAQGILTWTIPIFLPPLTLTRLVVA